MKIEENEKKAYIKELGSRKGKNQDRETMQTEKKTKKKKK